MKAWYTALLVAVLRAVTGCGHISEADFNAGETKGDAAHPGSTFTVGVALHFRAESELDALIARLYDPQSPDYGKFLTPQQFQQRFGPDPATVTRVARELSKQGMHVSRQPHGQFLLAKTNPHIASRVFGAKVEHHPHADVHHKRTVHGNVSLPSGVAAVHNLHSPVKRRPMYRSVPANFEPVNVQPLTGTQIRSVYNVPPAANAAPRHLALVELDGYNPADIATYAQQNGMPVPKLTNILVDGYDGQVVDPDAQVEVTMDIEVMMAMAGPVKEIRMYETSQQLGSLVDLFNEIANPTLGDKWLVHTISCSWGAPESGMSMQEAKAEAMVFKQLAAQGQTVFAASGDSGAVDDGRALGTDDPASQPYVVAVGGTTLNSQNGKYISESAWYDGQGGGGGGTSRFWPIPSWQVGVAPAASRASTAYRNVPDVSLNADPQTGYAVYVSGQWMVVGGTSCAAPIWAAFFGITNAQRNAHGLPDIGFLSPILYSRGKTGAGATAFHDIQDNSTNGYYPAVKGFDDATGWGSMDGAKFLQSYANN